jgi:hypothetical protein
MNLSNEQPLPHTARPGPPFLPHVTADVRLNRIPFHPPSATVQKHPQCAYAAHSATEMLLLPGVLAALHCVAAINWVKRTWLTPPRYLTLEKNNHVEAAMSLHKHWPLAWLSLKRQAPPLARHLRQLGKHTHLNSRSSQG